jgi:nicotinate dehydrogenase large molybdopterin subunit
MQEETIMALSQVGQRRKRIEGLDQVTGVTKYSGDVYFPNTLHCKALHSPLPHAKILNMDTSKAEKIKGVEAVITSKDFPELFYGHAIPDRPVLAYQKVRHVGELMAVVAARDVETAAEAVEQIKVDFEELPAIYDPRDAMKPDAIKIHDQGNIIPFYRLETPEPPEPGEDYAWWQRRQIRWGDVEEGFKKADKIYEHTFTTPMQEQLPIEPHVGLASLDGTGKLTIWTCSNMIFWHARDVTRLLHLPFAKVRMINLISGGGFGGKNDTTVEPHIGLIAMRTGKPVRWAWTTEEEFTTSTVRHPYIMTMKTGAMKDGTIVAKKMTSISDGGAYAEAGTWVMDKHCIIGAGPYHIPNVWVDGYVVYTNKQPGSALRGFGVAQATFAAESQMDIIAEDLGLDPFEIRMKNAMRDGDTTFTGQKLRSVAIGGVLEKAKEISHWQPLDWNAWKKEVAK